MIIRRRGGLVALSPELTKPGSSWTRFALDRRLDPTELALLCYLLVLSEESPSTNFRAMAHRFGCGQQRMRSALKGLVELGYVQRINAIDGKGGALVLNAAPVVGGK